MRVEKAKKNKNEKEEEAKKLSTSMASFQQIAEKNKNH